MGWKGEIGLLAALGVAALAGCVERKLIVRSDPVAAKVFLDGEPRGETRRAVEGAYRGKRVLIFGLGHFGGQIEATRFFARAGARVLATDLKDRATLAGAVEALRDVEVELRLGEHREEDFLAADLVV